MDPGQAELKSKIDKALEFKTQGNTHFRNGELI